MRTPFLGAYGVSRSTNASDNDLINLYAEIVPTKDAKAVGAFYMTPGLNLLAAVGAGPIRGIHVFAGVLYVVSGNALYSMSNTWTGAFVSNFVGNLLTSMGPVSIIDNGFQMQIFDGLNGYLIVGTSFTVQTLPFAGPVTATYQDGFGLVNQQGTDIWWQSNSFDLSTYDPLDFSSADGNPKDIIGIGTIHREQWLFKSNAIEVWVDAGQPGFSFQRLDGVYIETGLAAPFSIANIEESLVWLSQSNRGQGQIIMAAGYQPRVISTPQVEKDIQSYSTISDAIAYSYQQDGHIFYVITFPTANATWCYDKTSSDLAGVPMWHKRASFSNGQYGRHPGNAYVFFNGMHIIGDYQSGNIYSYVLGLGTDNGAKRKWLRRWRALPKPSEDQVTFSSLRIDMQTGIAVPDGTNPLCMLRWTDDGGHNFSNYRIGAVGKTGETGIRVKFNRLGSTRLNAGLDRIFELSSTDIFGVALIGAELN